MKKYLLHPNDAQKILNYLATRSYAEVYQLIPILNTMEETEVDEAFPVPENLEVTD